METDKTSFDDFWLEYVREHSHPLNRQLHMIGTGLALACVVAAVFKRRPSLLLLAPVFGYGFAWSGHFLVEKNMPKSFSRPLDSLHANLLLFWKTLCGEMDAELERARQSETGAPAANAEPTSAEVN